MNNRQMFSIKEAAQEMGLDKKTLRDKIRNGEIKVVVRGQGQKEKIFVSRAEVEKYLADNVGKITVNEKLQTIFDASESMYFGVENLDPIPLQRPSRKSDKEKSIETVKDEVIDFEPKTPNLVPDTPPAFIWDLGPEEVYDFEPTQTIDETDNIFYAQPYEPPSSFKSFSRAEATRDAALEVESILRTMSQEYKRRLEEQKQLNLILQTELIYAKRQLRLLPDLQKQADEVYLKEFELSALRKQVNYLKEAYNQALQSDVHYVYEDEYETSDIDEIDDEKLGLLEESVLPEMDRQIQKLKRVQEAEQSLVLDRLKLDATKRQEQNQNLSAMKERIEELEGFIASMSTQVQETIEKLPAPEAAPVKKPWWKAFLGL